MTIKHTLKTILIICGLSIVAACKSSAPTLDPIVMLNYCKEPTTATLENLSKNYGSFINKSRKKGVKQPGIYSDYAVTLVQLGKRAEANSWFNKEMEAFPASRTYVAQLKRMLLPEYVNNNSINVNEASIEDDSEQDAPTKAQTDGNKTSSKKQGNSKSANNKKKSR